MPIKDEIRQIVEQQILNARGDIKTESFDFHQLSQDITNSITDQLYRDYLPALHEKYKRKIVAGSNENENIGNDLNVDNIVESISTSLPPKISDAVVESIVIRVKRELDEQYHPREKSYEDRRDRGIKFIRHFITPAYFLVGIVLLFISGMIALEVWEVVNSTKRLYQWHTAGEELRRNLNLTQQGSVSRFYINQIVAVVLSILDLLLLAALVVMVLIGGFENTVGRIGMSHDVPTWFGKVGITELKLKVAASIVIISSIHLLTFFMLLDVTKRPAGNDKDQLTAIIGNFDYNYEALMWTAIVHGVFVISALALAYMSKITGEESY